MIKRSFIFYITAIFAVVLAHPAEAKESAVLYLDSGFVGRQSTFQIFNGSVKIVFDRDSLLEQNELVVQKEDVPTSTSDGYELGDEKLTLQWKDAVSVSSNGVYVDMPGKCVRDAWTECRLFLKDGDAWRLLKGDRVIGNAEVRIGIKRSSYMTGGDASWYAYKKCRCAASPDFPKGSRVKVTSKASGKSTVVRINDYGPERDKFPKRVIDLDVVAFTDLAPKGAGIIGVTVKPVGKDDPEYLLADAPVPASKIVVKSKKSSKK